MIVRPAPIATLAIKSTVKGASHSEHLEPVYGGYANARGDIVLFAKDLAYHVNFKNQILKQRPPLNAGAQARYDAAEAGDDFVYGAKPFRRLSPEEITDICTASQYRISPKF